MELKFAVTAQVDRLRLTGCRARGDKLRGFGAAERLPKRNKKGAKAGTKNPRSRLDKAGSDAIVDRAKVTLESFLNDPNFSFLHDSLDSAKGVLIFPQILKGGFVVGGSGGTGVLVIRDQLRGDWGEPAFYTLGSMTVGLQIGAESAEMVMMAMTDKAVESLLSSSFEQSLLRQGDLTGKHHCQKGGQQHQCG